MKKLSFIFYFLLTYPCIHLISCTPEVSFQTLFDKTNHVFEDRYFLELCSKNYKNVNGEYKFKVKFKSLNYHSEETARIAILDYMYFLQRELKRQSSSTFNPEKVEIVISIVPLAGIVLGFDIGRAELKKGVLSFYNYKRCWKKLVKRETLQDAIFSATSSTQTTLPDIPYVYPHHVFLAQEVIHRSEREIQERYGINAVAYSMKFPKKLDHLDLHLSVPYFFDQDHGRVLLFKCIHTILYNLKNNEDITPYLPEDLSEINIHIDLETRLKDKKSEEKLSRIISENGQVSYKIRDNYDDSNSKVFTKKDGQIHLDIAELRKCPQFELISSETIEEALDKLKNENQSRK